MFFQYSLLNIAAAKAQVSPQTKVPEKTVAKLVKKVIKAPAKTPAKPKVASASAEKKIVKIKTEGSTVRQVTVKPSQKSEATNLATKVNFILILY